MKVKHISSQQYLDLAALGMPVWSFESAYESNLLRVLSNAEAQRVERDDAVILSKCYENFVTLVDDDSDDS